MDRIWQRVSDTGPICFPPLPLSSCDEQVRPWEGMWVTVQEEGNINTWFYVFVFLFLPVEPQLVKSQPASAMQLLHRQVQTSACSCLRERQEAAEGKQRPVSVLGTSVCCTVGRYDLTGWLAHIARTEQGGELTGTLHLDHLVCS